MFARTTRETTSPAASTSTSTASLRGTRYTGMPYSAVLLGNTQFEMDIKVICIAL